MAVTENVSQVGWPMQTTRKRWFRDTHWQQIVWIITVLFASVAFAVVGYWYMLFVGLPVAGLGAWRFERAIGYELPGLWLKDYEKKRRGDNNLFDAEEREVPVIELQDAEFPPSIGTLIDREKDTFTVYFWVKGFRASLKNDGVRVSAMQRFVKGLKRAMELSPEGFRWGTIVGNRPFDARKWANTTKQHYMHAALQAAYDSVTSPEQLAELSALPPAELHQKIKSGEITRELGQAINQAKYWQKREREGNRFVRLLYLTFDRPSDLAPEEYTAEEFEASTMGQSLIILHEAMVEAGFLKVEILDRKAVQRMVYEGWNVLTNEEAVERGVQVGFDPSKPIWPSSAMHATTTTVITDTCHHAVLVTTSFAEDEITPDGMDAFLTGHMPNVLVTMQAVSIDARKERWFSRQVRNFTQEDIDKYGGPTEAEHYDRIEQSRNAIDEQYRSGTAVRFNVRLLCSGSSAEQVERVVQYETAKLRVEGHASLRVTGRETLPRAVEATMYGTEQ